jgi:hypothetical protein
VPAAQGARAPPPPPLPPPLAPLLAAPPAPPPPSPLAAAAPPPDARTLAGLLAASWPGRAQVLPLPGAPGTTLYLDGAHTDRSMREAVAWYRGELTAARAREPCVRHVPLLVFNCLPEKDSLGLLLPLSALPFEGVFIAAAASARGGGGSGAPSADTVRGGFLAKKRGMGDGEAVAALEEGGWGAEGGAPPPPPPLPGGAARGGGQWQDQLAQLWAWAHSDPSLQPLRAWLAAAPSAGDSGGAGTPVAPLTAEPPPAAILPGVDAVLDALRARAAGPARLHVLVSGSLYLVGEVWGKARDSE